MVQCFRDKAAAEKAVSACTSPDHSTEILIGVGAAILGFILGYASK